MAAFTGRLNSNEIFASLFNMIISQQVFADNIKGTYASLVDEARVDGTLYGDTKLYYSTDILQSYEWGNDAEAENLLKLYRPEAPEVQAIVLNKFRQIPLTVDNYLSKRAWSTEGAFSDFNSVMLGWIRETKRVYDATTYNAFIGTTDGKVMSIDVTTPTKGLTGEEKSRVEGAVIAEYIANLLAEMNDVSRDFNDYGNMRSYDTDELAFVWNTEAISAVEKRDLPTIYHKDIMDKFGEYKLPSRYFGKVNAEATVGNGTTIRSLVEQIVKKASSPDVHVFAGDLIPEGYTAPENTSYTVDKTILFKVIHKGPSSVPYMSAFEVGTSFFNPKSLTETHYLTWGHNTLEYLKNYPFITVKKS